MFSAFEFSRQQLGRQRLSRRRLLSVAAAGTTGATVLAACGGRKAGKTANSAATSQTGKPRPGGELNTSTATEPFNWDPAHKLVPSAQAFGLVYNSLLAFKSGSDVKYYDQTLIPSLAEHWETPDAQTYTFHLQQGVKFANLPPVNGRAFTSADVKFTFEYLTRTGNFKDKRLPPSQAAALFATLDSVETPDSATAVIHFAQPFTPFQTYVANDFASILPHEIFDEDGGFAKRAIGTGPWQWDPGISQKGARVVFKRNPTYFQPNRPYIDQINWLILPDDATMNAAFLAKQADLLDYQGVTLETVQQTQKTLPTVGVQEYVSLECLHIFINVSKPPLNDTRIRKAFALSIDRDEFMRVVSSGKGQWALSGALPSLFTEEEVKQILKPDLAQAKRLLSDAGHSNSVDLEFMYPGLKYGQQLITKLQLLQAQVKKAGINLALKSLDAPAEDNRRRSGDFQLAVTPTELVTAGDMDGPLYIVYDPKSPANYGKVNDPDLTPMLEQQRREVDLNKRKEIARQAVHRINEQAWGLALYFPPAFSLSQSYLKNYAENVGYYHNPLTDAWIEK